MIRKGNLDDAAQMAEIYNHYVRTSTVIFSNIQLSAEDMRVKLKRLNVGSEFPFFVDEADGHINGYCYAHLWHPDPVYGGTWELTMYLAPDSCGHGLGTRLMDALIEACRAGGAHSLISCVTGGNEPCEKMHIAAGFNVAGNLRGVGYKFGQRLDDVFYQLTL